MGDGVTPFSDQAQSLQRAFHAMAHAGLAVQDVDVAMRQASAALAQLGRAWLAQLSHHDGSPSGTDAALPVVPSEETRGSVPGS